MFLPFQLVLVSPLLVPVWALGWWRLARDPALPRGAPSPWRTCCSRSLFMVTGGKPYYLAGLYPVLLAAGGAGGAGPGAPRGAAGRALGVALALALACRAC